MKTASGMQYTRLSGLDTEVSRIAFGCMSTVGSQTYPGLAEREAVDTIRAALDAGINFFDTARAYGEGESEAQLGRALGADRQRVVVASKPIAGDLSSGEIERECELSLERLGSDYIDLYQIHWPKRAVPMQETARAMERLVEQGKVRAIGVCNFGPLDLREWLDLAPCATDQVAYSLLSRGAESGLLELCVERGVGVLCYSPLAQGMLAGRYASADDVPSGKARTRHFSGDRPEARHGEPGLERETFDAVAAVRGVAERLGEPMADVSLAWLLARPGVSAVLVGASRPDQVHRNARAAAIELSAADIADLDAATAGVKAKMGPSIDMWAVPPRTR